MVAQTESTSTKAIERFQPQSEHTPQPDTSSRTKPESLHHWISVAGVDLSLNVESLDHKTRNLQLYRAALDMGDRLDL